MTPSPEQPLPPPTAEDPDLAGLGYREALAQLDAILVGLEDDDLDVDLLGQKVARAAALIRLCRERVQGAQVEIERIVADLDVERGGSPR